MIVGICLSKTTENAHDILNCFAKGIEESGDQYIPIKTNDDIKLLAKADCAVQLCSFNTRVKSSYKTIFRNTIREFQKNNGKRTIIIDAGLTPGYLSVGFDGIKNFGKYYSENSPSDRFNELNIEIKPWRTSGKHIIILGQTKEGSSVPHTNVYGWYVKVIKYLKKHTDRKIIFRPHPKIVKKPGYFKTENKIFSKFVKVKINTKLEDDLENCWAAFGITTNASVIAILNGIPLFSDNPINMCSPVMNTDFSKLEEPILFNRKQWAYDLAYCQWTRIEMKLGLPWRHLREHI